MEPLIAPLSVSLYHPTHTHTHTHTQREREREKESEKKRVNKLSGIE